MEIDISAGDVIASISCSTSITNAKLAVAVVTCTSTAMTRNEHLVYSRLKTAALEAIAGQIGTYPLVVERSIPELWSVNRQRRRAAAAAAATALST